jgi:hypothetical protein
MLFLALIVKADKITLTGEAIDMIQEDDAFKEFQGEVLLNKVFKNPAYGKSDFRFSADPIVKQVGGARDASSMFAQFLNPYSSKYEETRQVGNNPLSWMLRTATFSAEGYVSKDGQIRISYSVEDTFDLRWEEGRGTLFNIISSGLGSIWHDGLGATEPSVQVNWITTINLNRTIRRNTTNTTNGELQME